MTAFFIIIGIAAAILVVIAVVSGGHKFDEQMRGQQLIEEAKRKYPRKSLLEALDLLWRETIKELKLLSKHGKNTEDLERDCIILLNERSKLIETTIENESGYEAMPGRISNV